MGTEPDILQYDDFAAYLSAYIAYRKKRHPWFSIRWIAKKASLPAPATLSLILGGQRAPTLPTVEKICSAISLPREELRYAVLITARRQLHSTILHEIIDRSINEIQMTSRKGVRAQERGEET